MIDGAGRTLMPGLIDAHTHIMFISLPQVVLLTADVGFVNLAAAKAANDMLMRGFTSIRDLGGPSFGLKRAIDAGLAVGPRIWPSGAMISQTGGHGDFRLPTDLPAAPEHGIRTAWGTDILFSPAAATEQGAMLAKMAKWYSPIEALRMATRDNAELLALSGARSPYPGKLGVVEVGALADLLLVDGDPIADLTLVADPHKNLKLIMKGGRIYKNTL